uniref:Apical junction molecule ajm1 alpha/beta domain-containing protein n=1 Tax=Clytia hemisphaerica TaxID=252671 RepID=A0A7M5UNX0_9CNID
MAGDQLLDEIWYDADTVFYMVVAMLTFTSIIGTLLYYKDRLIARPQNEEEEEEEVKETLEVTPQWRDPVLQVPSEVAKEETNQPENVEEMSKQQQQVEEHTMKQDPSLFAVLSDVCDAYAPKTQDPNKTENLQSVVGSLADFEVNAAKDDVSCMAMIDTITNEKPPISKETQLESSNPMKSQSANSSPFKSQSSTSRSLQDALSIHDETFDGHLKDAILVKHKSSDSIDTLDMSLSSISDSEIPDTPELTHVSRDQTHDDESSFDSSECQLHITSESLSNDNSEITDVSRMDATLDETLDLSKDEGFLSSTPRKGVPPVAKERTVFEEIVETRTEIVVESTYEVENDPQISDVEDCGDNKNDQDKGDNIPLIVVEDLVDSTVDTLQQQENTENEVSEIQPKGDNIPKIVEELVDSTIESECNEAPRILDESTLSLAEGDIMDTTIDLKEAVIGEQTEPLNVAKKLLLDEESPVNKRKGKVKRNDSWRFSSDYRLSSSSQSLIDSIECDMEDEFLDGLDPEEDKIHQDVQEMLDVRGSLRSVDDVDKAPKKLTTLRSKDDGDNKVSPRRLKKGDKGREWKSKSLHSIFSTDQMETDIDNINEQELVSIMKSPKLKEKHQGVFVTDVDKAFKSSPSTPTNETKKPKKYVVVSRRSNIRKYSADIPTTDDGLSTGLETRSKSLDTKRAPAVRSLIPKTKKHEKKANNLHQETDIDLEDEAFETEPSTTSTATAIDVPPLTVKATAGVPADFPATKDVETKQDAEVELPSSTTVEAVIETVVKQVTESQKEIKPVDDTTVRAIDEADVSKIVSNEPATEGNTPTSDTKVDNIVELLNEANKGLNDQDSLLTQSDNKRFVITEEIIKTDVEQEVEKSPEMLLNGMRVHADEPAAQEYVQTDLHILHIDQSDERMKPKEVIVNVPTGHIKATIQGRAVEKNRRNRDSWDILADEPKLTEKSPTDNKLVIEKGLFKRESHVNGNVIEQKHLSWNILDLKEQDEKLLDDFFKNGYMNEPVNKRNSNDIGFLFEKYQREREALKKLQEKETKRYSVGSMSDFSEISSVSDDEAPEESRKQGWSDIEDPEISLNKAISEGMDSDLFKPIQRSGNHVDPSTPKAETAPSSAFSPVLRRNENKATKPFSPSKQPLSPSKGKTEETKIKPLPEPVKPDFVPEVSTFSEEDLGSMVMAQAVSAVRKRRGGRGRGRRNVNAEQQLASQPASTPETKTPEITAPVNTVPQSPPKPPRGIPKRTTAPVFEVSVETTQVAPLSQENVQKLNASLPLDRKRTDSSSNSTEATIKSSMRKPLQEPPITSPRSSSAQRMRDLNQNYLPSPKSPRLIQKSASMNFQAPTSPRLQPKALNLNQTQSPKSPRWEPTSPKSPRIQPSPRSAKHLTPRESGNKKLRPDFANGNNNNNTRSYDYINSMPDIFHKSKLASGDIEYCEEDYNSEASLMSDIGIDSTFEGSIVDDQMLLYPSLHTNANDIRSKAMINEFTDSSGDESFTTEQTDRFRQQIPTSATERTVYCGYTGCSHKQVMVGNEKSKFISCNSCFTCYCSKTCKRMHWLDHRKSCFFGRINVYIKTIVRKCEKENKFNSFLKTFALKNYRAIGRGCVVLTFNSPSEAKEMTSQKAERLAHQPTYSTIDNVIKKNKQSKHSKVLCQSLLDYDPEQEFVVNISIRIGKTRTSNSKKRTSNVVRCARISSIEIPDLFDKALSSYYIRTFCLPRVAVNDYMNDVEVRRYYCKELSFSLKRCGVRLKLDYPEAYEKLSRYVEDERPFLPIVLYGQKSGKNYKCILHQGKYNHSEEARGEGVLV